MSPISGGVSASGSVGLERVAQDGTLYNSRELRRELERAGHTFRTDDDAEVLLHLYEEHGDAFAARLRGMFAVAIWDAPRRRLVLARDRFGIKPLYYRGASGELAFASELSALPHAEVDLEAVQAFLAFGEIPAPLTIFEDSRKLPAGHLLSWEDGVVRLERFARPAPLPERHDDRAELVEELRSRLRDSVRAHLVGDAPLGVLLSGGVYSALLAPLAAEESSEPLRTFAIGFEEGPSDELAHARQVAARYETQHRELVLRPDAALLLPALAEAFDEPFADFSALPTYLVSELAASDVTVALSGEGGAELFEDAENRKEIFAPDVRAELTGRQTTFDHDVDFVQTDRAPRAHSLEVRLPYLDTVVTNLALTQGLAKKVLVRKAAEPLIPREILRGKKRAATWLRGGLEPFARETLSAKTLRRQGFFEPRVVQRLIDEHAAGRGDLSRELWALLAFTLWHERHVEREPAGVRMPELLAER
jgi:asparagine synthetase B (glutamine-hydrolysing)